MNGSQAQAREQIAYIVIPKYRSAQQPKQSKIFLKVFILSPLSFICNSYDII